MTARGADQVVAERAFAAGRVHLARERVLARRQPRPAEHRGERRRTAVLLLLRVKRHAGDLGPRRQAVARRRAARQLPASRSRPAWTSTSQRPPRQRRCRIIAHAAAAHLLMVDEREDVGEAEQIGQQQDQEDEQDRADDDADGALPGRQLIQLARDLAHLRIGQRRDPRRRLGRDRPRAPRSARARPRARERPAPARARPRRRPRRATARCSPEPRGPARAASRPPTSPPRPRAPRPGAAAEDHPCRRFPSRQNAHRRSDAPNAGAA